MEPIGPIGINSLGHIAPIGPVEPIGPIGINYTYRAKLGRWNLLAQLASIYRTNWAIGTNWTDWHKLHLLRQLGRWNQLA